MVPVIIPTLDAERQIGPLLASLKQQTVACSPIVVDSSDSGATAEVARSYGAEVLSVSPAEFDHGATRNAAAQRAGGELVVFLTQDALPCGPASIENLLKPFSDPRVAAAYGRQLPHPGAGPFGAHLRSFNYPPKSVVRGLEDRERFGIRTAFLSNSFAAYRKAALEGIGGFRKGLILGEDTCAAAQLLLAGYRLAYAAEAEVFHSHTYSVLEEFRRYFDIGVLHTCEHWLLREFGRAEGEGLRYLKSELGFLFELGRPHLIAEMVLRNALKYAGYRLGRAYEVLPRGVVPGLSMHPQWWRRRV